MSPEILSSYEKGEPLGRVDEKETNTDRNPGASVVLIIGEGEDSDESSLEESQSTKRAKISHIIEAESYPIDFMDCETTHKDLDKLRMEYNILDDIELKIPHRRR